MARRGTTSLEFFDARTGVKLRSAARALISLALLVGAMVSDQIREASPLLAPAIYLAVEAIVQLFVVDTDAPFIVDESIIVNDSAAAHGSGASGEDAP